MRNGVLFISPSASDAAAVTEMLSSINIHCDNVGNLRKARQKMEAETFGAVLTDSSLPDGTWKDVVKMVRNAKRSSAVVVSDRLADADFWVDALELGAYDVLLKPFCCGEVQRILANALHEPAHLTGAIAAA